MKTPREILFARHQAAAPKLDAIRREVVARIVPRCNRREAVRKFTFAATVAMFNRDSGSELIWPCRRIWAGLAAVWILIFAFNFSQRDPAEMHGAKIPAAVAGNDSGVPAAGKIAGRIDRPERNASRRAAEIVFCRSREAKGGLKF